MKKKYNRNKVLKKAGVLLAAVVMILSTMAVMANASEEHVALANPKGQAGNFEPHPPNPLAEEYIGFYNPHTVDDNAIGLQGGQPPYRWQSAIRITPDELAVYDGWELTGVNVYHHESRFREGNLFVYEEGLPTRPGTRIRTEPFTFSGSGWKRIDLGTPVVLDAREDIWVSIEWVSYDNDFPASVDAGPAIKTKGDWLYMNSQWQEIWQQFDVNWCLEAIVFQEEQPDPLEANPNGPYYGYVDVPIQFNGTATGGTPPYEYFWQFGNGHTSSEEDPVYAYPKAGNYTVTLWVRDSEQTIDNNVTWALVTEIEPLLADADGPYNGEVGEDIQFTGSAHGGVEPYTWLWDFGNGDTSDEQNPVYSYSAVGNYTVTLKVTDDVGTIDDDETTATITESPREPELEVVSIQSGFGFGLGFGLGVDVIVKNIGDADATNVQLGLTVTGGILKLIDKNVSETVPTLAVDEETTISSGLIFGLGKVDIVATATCAEGSSDVGKATGLQIIILTLVI